MNFDQFYDTMEDICEERKINEKTVCCKVSNNFIIHNGITSCRVCNTLLSNISDSPEWRFYGSNDTKSTDPTRCGMPSNILLPESSIGSTINFKNNSKTMNQIRRYQQFQGMPYKERSKYKVFNTITDKCKKHNINSKIIEESKSLYNMITEIKISRGSNRIGIIAACVYFACKSCNVPRSSKEIADIFDINITVMTKGCKNFTNIMNLDKKNKNRINNTPINAYDFIERFCSTFNVDVMKIYNICKISIEQNIISQNTPPSIAAGCIYYFIKKEKINITKKQLSDICKISEVTINKCYKKIEENDHLFND